MKRLFVLLILAMLTLALCACTAADPGAEETAAATDVGQTEQDAVPEPVTQEQETEQEQANEPSAPLPDGVAVTSLSPGDKDYQKYKDFILREREARPTEYVLPNGDKIVSGSWNSDFGNVDIYLQTAAGEKILLVAGFASFAGQVYQEGTSIAYACQMLDDHRFIYAIDVWEKVDVCGLYDLREMKDYRFNDAGADPLLVVGDTLFSRDNSNHGESVGEFGLTKTDLTTFQTDMLLESVSEELLLKRSAFDISPDGKLFAIITSEPYSVTHIFSLESEELICSLPSVFAKFYSTSQLIDYNSSKDSIDGKEKIILIDINM